MKRTLKIGAIISIISIASIVVAGFAINYNVIKPLPVISTNSEFEGVNIEVNTDKDVYAVGEEIEIDVSLTNTNNDDLTIYCQGWRNSDSDELYSLFHVTIYDENYTKVWYRTIPDKNDYYFKKIENHPSSNYNKSCIIDMNGNTVPENDNEKTTAKNNYPRYFTTHYSLNINASSTNIYNNISSWNQTAKNIRVIVDNVVWYDFNKQVPTGTYIITATVPLNMNYYFGNVYKEFYFGNSKTIKII